MRLFNILFLAIRESEYVFLKYRHSIDSTLFSVFSRENKVTHLKLFEPSFTPQAEEQEIYFKGGNGFFHIPFALYRFIYRQKPDIILIHGFSFPVQLLFLLVVRSKKTKILVQHHAEKPFLNRIKRRFQKMAYSRVEGYLFTSVDLARSYLDLGIIKDKTAIHEVMEGSTLFEKKDKATARQTLNWEHTEPVFLWVARLDQNKDPLLVLEAFKKHKEAGHFFKLYMIYGSTDLEAETRKFIQTNRLEADILLIGKVEHTELETWYNAADYHVTASHYEGGGIALCEAMACGCIPIATRIPSFIRMTENGVFGFLFEPGNGGELTRILCSLDPAERESMSLRVAEQFKKELSLAAIGKKIERIALSLL